MRLGCIVQPCACGDPLETVLREVELGLLEYADQVGEPIHHRLSFARLVRVVEVGKVATGEAFVRLDQLSPQSQDLLANPTAQPNAPVTE